ncbi:hypothetical protein R3I93_019579 [Phoxinus phoxinus]|jgi:hypothetical protein
MDGS